MTHKLIRLAGYCKELVLMAFFMPLCALLRKTKKYKSLWLVSERGDDARDNGYWFYKYLKEEHPEINSRYVITEKSADFSKISALGGAIEYGSFYHYLAYFAAKNLIGTHVQPCAPDKIMYYHLAKKGIRAKGKQTFLQHGIIKDYMSWLDGEHLYIDLFVCGAYPEYENIKNTYHHRDGVVKYVGLSRFDNLLSCDEKEKMILIMPTWRGANYPGGDEFLKTPYFKAFSSLINNSKLISMLEEKKYRIVFYPHIEMQKYIKAFSSSSDRIIIADKSSYDVQELLLKCSMMITDYSSVFFDVAYLEKPIVYYQFDEEDFYSYHYKKGYFDFRRDGFGPVVTDEETLVSEIKKCFDADMVCSEEYTERTKKFFVLRDCNNRKRTFDAICEMD